MTGVATGARSVPRASLHSFRQDESTTSAAMTRSISSANEAAPSHTPAMIAREPGFPGIDACGPVEDRTPVRCAAALRERRIGSRRRELFEHALTHMAKADRSGLAQGTLGAYGVCRSCGAHPGGRARRRQDGSSGSDCFNARAGRRTAAGHDPKGHSSVGVRHVAYMVADRAIVDIRTGADRAQASLPRHGRWQD